MLEAGTQTGTPAGMPLEEDMRGCRERCSALLGVVFGAVAIYVIMKYAVYV